MSKMITVNKQFLADTFGISYLVQGSYSVPHLQIIETLAQPYAFNAEESDEVEPEVPDISIVEQPYGYNHPTPEAAFADLLLKQADTGHKDLLWIEEETNKFANKVLLFRHSKGWLPAKRMKSMDARIKKNEEMVKLATTTPVFEERLVLLEDEYLIVDGFIKPEQTCYVFEKAHSIHFESFVYEVKAVKVSVNPSNGSKDEPAQVFMSVDLQTDDCKKHFHLGWSSFKDFNGDYFTTGTTGQYVFTDKEKCLSFAKAMMQKDIEKLQNNMNTLSL